MRPNRLLNRCTKTALAALLVGSMGYTSRAQEPGTSDKVPSSERRAGERKATTGANEIMTSQQFAQKAALGGQKEVFLSQTALRKTDNAQIKSFAQQMIRDHTAVGQQLMQIAQTKGIQLPPTNAFENALESATSTAQTRPGTPTSRPTDIEQRSTDIETRRTPTGRPESAKTPLAVPESEVDAARKLERLSGSQFDRAYISEMASDHRKAVAKFERASQSLDDAELKQFATDTLPKLREHSQMAEQLSQSLGGKRLNNE